MADRRLVGRWSLRTRIVALATLVVAVVLLAGGVVLGFVLQQRLVADVRQAALLRASDLAALAVENTLPSPVPIGDDDEAFVQVVAGNRVMTASANISGRPPLDLVRPAAGEVGIVATDLLLTDDEADDDPDEEAVIASATVLGPNGPVTVYVSASLEDAAEANEELLQVGAIVLPVLVGVLAVAMWLLVGRTLAPVEQIRAEADAISGRELHRRVPEPATDDEIGRLAATLNRMLARLEDASERQRRFIADAAHELRTPIATLRTRLETSRSSPREVDWPAVADDLLAETLRMQQLTEQLLLLARADAGAFVARHRAVDLDDVVVDAAAVRGPDPDLTIAVDVEPVQVLGEPVLLGHVIGNLLGNAEQHARHRIAITLRRHEDRAVVTVDDDGPGIPPAQRAAVFERFTRLDHARVRDRGGGAGLGLAIVSDIVAVHGGDVRALASPLGGTRLEVTLPLTTSA